MPEAQAAKMEKTPATAVFISHASHDKAVADAVCEALEKAGVTCWIAPRDVTPGEFYAESIVHAIDSTQVIVLVLSQNGAASPHVLREVERASSKRHPVVSFRIDAAPLPAALEYFLNSSQWLDASTAGVARSLPRLVDAVKTALAQPVSSTPITAGPAVTTRPGGRGRRMVVALAAIVAATLGYFVVDRFWLSKHSAPATAHTTPDSNAPQAVAAVPEKSVAVLPFLDMSEKHDQEYFSDGLSEELIDMLTKVPDLRVPARTSSFYYKGKQTTIKDIAAALGVAHVLEGSVRQSGKIIRVTVQLIRVDNGYHLWSETFDRKLDDIFEVQDEIARAVVTSLKSSLQPNALPQGVGTTDSAAYTLYLQARAIDRLATTKAEYEGALKILWEAVARDPKFAEGWAWIAFIHSNEVINNLDDAKGIAEMRQAATEAMRLSPNSANAHTIAASIFWGLDWNWLSAEAEFRRAYELEPSNPTNAGQLADAMLLLGRDPQKIRELLDKSVARDPTNYFFYVGLSTLHLVRGELIDADMDIRKALQLNGSGADLHAYRAYLLLLQHKYEDALLELGQERDETARRQGLAVTYYALGRRADADAALRDTERLDGESAPAGIAEIYAYRGEAEQAFSWLERAYRQRDQVLASMNRDPLMKKLYADPRWSAFLGKMKLPVLSRTAYPGVY